MEAVDVRQHSTHTQEKRTRDTDDLEAWLEAWGAWRRAPIPQLYYPSQSTVQTMRELKPPHRSLTQRLITWAKNPSQTLNVRPKVPNYTRKPRIDKIHRAINDLPDHLYAIIHIRYELEYTWKTARDDLAIPQTTYHYRLKKAKKALAKLL